MRATDRLSGIAVFVEVARSLSFTQAADRLGVTKSAVGKSVARLEARLGVRLLYRSTRKLSLTSDGEAFFARCAAALEEMLDAEASLSAMRLKPSGMLRIDMPVLYGRKIVLPLLLHSLRSNPDLRFSMTFRDSVINPIDEGIDLVVRFGELPDTAGLVSRKLIEQRFSICASPDYIERRGQPRSLTDIRHHECIVSPRPGGPHAWTVCDEAGDQIRFHPPATHEIADGDAMLAAALAGCGLLQMPDALLRPYIRSRELIPVLTEVPSAVGSLYAVWPTTRSLLPKVRFVVDILVNAARTGHLG
jgi:DNA-binding transcriptional LysR family regulator